MLEGKSLDDKDGMLEGIVLAISAVNPFVGLVDFSSDGDWLKYREGFAEDFSLGAFVEVGNTDGSILGDTDRTIDGLLEGKCVLKDGLELGSSDCTGERDGTMLGTMSIGLGLALGMIDGIAEGLALGVEDGISEG